MPTLSQITQSIMQDPDNQSFTSQGIEPLFAAPTTARINIVGQAPGIKAQESRLYWNDKSGDRLREWLGVDRDTFYHSSPRNQIWLKKNPWFEQEIVPTLQKQVKAILSR